MNPGFGYPELDLCHFETDKLLIVAFPSIAGGGGGGKFLIHCLSLSRHAVMFNFDLALKQVNGELTSKEKFEILIGKMKNHAGPWNDITFPILFHTPLRREWRIEVKNHWPWPKGFKKLIESGLVFFDSNHYTHELSWQHQIWPQAKTIYFTDIEEFIKAHRPGRQYRLQFIQEAKTRWQQIRQNHWPELPPMSVEALTKPPFDQFQIVDDELLGYLPNEQTIDYLDKVNTQALLNEVKTRAWAEPWSCLWYLDKSLHVYNIEKLYQILGFDDFNRDYMNELYDIWYNISKNT